MLRILRGFLVVLALLGGPAVLAQSVLGEWKLVEQTYGRGQSNLVAEEDVPVRLELFRQGSTVRGLVRGVEGEAVSWPRLVQDDRRRIHEEERELSAVEDRIRVRYRVDPGPGDDLVLEVTEDYRVAEDGRALVGTVEIRFVRDGKDRGSYRLHRRYERLR